MLEVGAVIAGKLRIERILGRGGMGVVAEATHLQLDQRVAVKVMLDKVADDPSTVERFLREARAAAKLRSEHVVRVTDVGQLDSGAPYIVMELLAGSDLAALVAHRPLAIETAVDHVLQACIAIGEAHVQGIVHRDLKPANLFLTKHVGGAPLVKVLDFGIAKAPSRTDTALTQTESVMGSPGYMSPEQLRSARDVDLRTDIWALGVILYQLVSCRLPFPAASVTELAMKVGMDPPEPLDIGNDAFRAVVFRCLEKSPSARYADVPALAAALAPFGSESARRSLAVIEQLRPKPTADALAATIAPQQAGRVDVLAQTAASSAHAPTAASIGSGPQQPITTLGGAATGYANVPPTERTRAGLRRPLIIAGLGLPAAAIAAVIALNSNRGGGSKPAASAETAPATASAGTASPAALAETPPPAGSAEPPPPAGSAVADPPATTPPPTGGKAATIAALKAKFDRAVKAERCFAATYIVEDMKKAGVTNDVLADVNPRLNTCLSKEADEISDLTTARGARTMLKMAEERLAANMPGPARELADTILHFHSSHHAARALALRAACKEGKVDIARGYVAPLPAKHLDEALAYCKAAGVDPAKLATAKAEPAATTTTTTTTTLKGQEAAQAVGYLLTQNYAEARDLALAVLSNDPKNTQVMYQLILAYCSLDDAPNAMKWAKKIDPARLDKILDMQCRHLHIDITNPK